MKPKNKVFNPIAAFILFLVGIICAGNQVLVNNMALSLGASEAQMGSIISSSFVGSMIMVLFLGELSEKVGKRGGLCAALAFVIAGSAILTACESVGVARIGMLFVGFGTGGLESITLSLVEDNNGDRTNNVMGYIQSMFSVGGVLAPMIIANLLQKDVYKPAYVLFAVFSALLIVFFLLYKRINEFAVKTVSDGGLVVFKVARNKTTLLSAFIMLLFSGCESGFCYWAVTFFRQAGAEGMGSYAVSAYWFTSIIGRLISAKIKNLINWYPWCMAAAAASVAAMVFSPTAELKLISMGLIGFFLAPIYGGLCFLGGHSVPEHSAAAYSLLIFGAALGGTLFQPIISSIATKWSLTVMYSADAVILIVMSLLTALCVRMIKSKQ